MGRMATHVAAAATHADNLPSPEKLPPVSIIDALLPWRVSSISSRKREPLGDNASKAPSVAYTDVKKDKNGKMRMVRHKAKASSVVDAGKGAKISTEDVKKVDKGGDVGGKAWTGEEDAKLRAMKGDGNTWAQITEELSRSKHELQARWKEINKNGAGAAAGGSKQEEKTSAGKKSDGNGDGGGDFTAEDDEKIKQLLASGTNYKQIAKELGRNLDKPLRGHIAKLQTESRENQKDDGATSKKAKKQDDNGEGRKDDKSKEERKKDENTGQGSKEEKRSSKENKEKGKQEKSPSVKKHHKAASKVGSHRSEAKFTMQEWIELQEDDLFSFAELQLLSEIIMRDSGYSWLRVASAFMDKTGRRVHPDDIRDKFGAMAEMGR